MKESISRNLKRFVEDESSGGSPEAAKKTLQAATLGAGMILGAPTAHPGPAEAGTVRVENTNHRLDQMEIDFLVQNVYHEARGESLKGQLAVAQVTLARLLSGKFGKKLSDVVFAQNQFSWTKDPRILMAKMDMSAFENLKTTVTFIMRDKTLGDAVSALVHETGLPRTTYYYKRTDWDENNPEDTRMSERTRSMFKNLNTVGKIGNHTFYTD